MFAALPSFTSLATNLGSPKILLTAKKSFAFTMALPETSIVQSTLEVSVLTPLIPFPVCRSNVSIYKSNCEESDTVFKMDGGLFPWHPVINVLDPQEKVELKSFNDLDMLVFSTTKGAHPISLSRTNSALGKESIRKSCIAESATIPEPHGDFLSSLTEYDI